jgi:hypothetical protein
MDNKAKNKWAKRQEVKAASVKKLADWSFSEAIWQCKKSVRDKPSYMSDHRDKMRYSEENGVINSLGGTQVRKKGAKKLGDVKDAIASIYIWFNFDHKANPGNLSALVAGRDYDPSDEHVKESVESPRPTLVRDYDPFIKQAMNGPRVFKDDDCPFSVRTFLLAHVLLGLGTSIEQ